MSVSQACILEHQLHSDKVKGFIKAYEYDFSASHWYLIPDTCPNGDDRYRLRTRFFPREDPIVYRVTEEEDNAYKSNPGSVNQNRTSLPDIICANHICSEKSAVTNDYETPAERVVRSLIILLNSGFS